MFEFSSVDSTGSATIPRQSEVDRLLNTVGVMVDIARTKAKKENDLFRTELRELTSVLNRLLSLHMPFHGTDSVLEAKQKDPAQIFDGISKTHRVRDIFALENHAQVYFLLRRSYYDGEHEKGQNFDSVARYVLAQWWNEIRGVLFGKASLQWTRFEEELC